MSKIKKMFKTLKRYRWIAVCGVLSLIVIFVLKFTDWRPFGYYEKAQAVNDTMKNLSFSLIAAIIFFLINDVATSCKRREISHNQICRQIRTIHELLRQMVESVEPFKFEKKIYTQESFENIFSNKDLYLGYYGLSRSMVDAFTENKDIIENISQELLMSYSEYMSDDELEYFDNILNSDFIRNHLSPMDFSVPKEFQHQYPNNQEEMGRSLFKLYKLKIPT